MAMRYAWATLRMPTDYPSGIRGMPMASHERPMGHPWALAINAWVNRGLTMGYALATYVMPTGYPSATLWVPMGYPWDAQGYA